MAINDKITTYSASVLQTNYLGYTRVIRLSLESGGTAYIAFPKERPGNWLQFIPGPKLSTNLFMTADDFDDVYRLLQTESPVFLTALILEGFMVGAVHTELDLSAGETPGEGDEDPQSLEALIRRARREQSSA